MPSTGVEDNAVFWIAAVLIFALIFLLVCLGYYYLKNYCSQAQNSQNPQNQLPISAIYQNNPQGSHVIIENHFINQNENDMNRHDVIEMNDVNGVENDIENDIDSENSENFQEFAALPDDLICINEPFEFDLDVNETD